MWSRVNLLRNDGEDGILVATAHHQSQGPVPLDGAADFSGGRNALPVNADDDVMLLQAAPETAKKERLTVCMETTAKG